MGVLCERFEWPTSVAVGSSAVFSPRRTYVRLFPDNGLIADIARLPFGAKLGHRSIFKTSPRAGCDRNGTRTYIRSTPRDETSVRLIADQGLVEQLGNQIVEEKEQLCPESSAVSGFPVYDNFCREAAWGWAMHTLDCHVGLLNRPDLNGSKQHI